MAALHSSPSGISEVACALRRPDPILARSSGGNGPMKTLHDVTVRVNSGAAWEMKKGQRVRITFQSIVDFVVFNRDNLQERFDQARTKANQGKIYLSTGDLLISKLNTPMMTIVEDTFKGTHDLQYGMCSECSNSEALEPQAPAAVEQAVPGSRHHLSRRSSVVGLLRKHHDCAAELSNRPARHPCAAEHRPAHGARREGKSDLGGVRQAQRALRPCPAHRFARGNELLVCRKL